VKFAFIVVTGAAALAACAKAPPTSEVVNVRPMAVAPVQAGDCVEARRRAAAEADLEVDRLPELVAGPRPFVPTPASVQADIDKKGMVFKADVVIDTLGKAIVSTLKVHETSNEWFPRNLRALLPRMTFSPAMLAGCKVQRVYKFTASAKAKTET
jgi:hypothetical protein